MSNKRIKIIGGAVVDVISKTKENEILHNSNIGEIEINVGGSGRNCAECIARLGYSEDVLLISGIGGNDSMKNEMIKQ